MAYATKPELAWYLGVETDTLPPGTNRLLERATEFVDYAAMYRVDTDDPDHVEAAKKATMAQVEYWMAAGEDAEHQGDAISSFTVGSLSVTYDTSKSLKLASRAFRALSAVGLTGRRTRLA